MKIINGVALLILPLFASGETWTWPVADREPPPPTASSEGGDSLEPEGLDAFGRPPAATYGEGGDSLEPENPAPIAPATTADANSPTTSGGKGQGRPMGISEKRQCYVYGQCQGYSVNFQQRDDAESCHMFCGKNEDCEWWTFEPSQSMCIAFKNCTESGNPDAGPCPDCISGEGLCPARECHDPHKCDGHFVNSWEFAHLEDCIRSCNDNPLCEFYTFEKSNDHCILFEDRGACEPCDTCASGEKKCSVGYHGTNHSAFMTPASKKVRFFHGHPKWDNVQGPDTKRQG